MHCKFVDCQYRVFLRFEAVGSAFYCWLNGTWLGYSQDSCLPAEFDVTTALQPGANTLAVQVGSMCPCPFVCSVFRADRAVQACSNIMQATAQRPTSAAASADGC